MAYVFKLNLGADAVKDYLKENLDLNQDILVYLDLTIGVKKSRGYYLIDSYKTEEKEEQEDLYLEFKSEYDEVLELTKELRIMYNQVFESYLETKDVTYPSEFLKLTSICGVKRNQLENKYGFLSLAEKLNDDYIIEINKLKTDRKIGTAITHLKKFYKIEYYVSKNDIKSLINSEPRVYFDEKKEHIIIDATSEKRAINTAMLFEKQLNKTVNFTKKLGKVKILPIYNKIEIDGKVKSVTYETSFPNGPRETHNLLSDVKSVEGDTKETTIKKRKGFLDTVKVQEILNILGKMGYLISIKVNEKIQVNKEIAQVDLEEEDQHDE